MTSIDPGLTTNGSAPSKRGRVRSQAPSSSDHIVQFYETEDALCDVVVDFLGSGFEKGERVIVIATEQHRRAFLEGLSARGFHDLATADGAPLLTLLDAEQTLASFMDESMPSNERFTHVIGETLEKVSAGRKVRVRAYGEMVDLLWRSGNPVGALKLEELWNNLQETHSFSLLCAYSMANFYKERGGFHDVCDVHTHVASSEIPSLSLTNGARYDEDDATEARIMAAEIRQRDEVESALRSALRDLRIKEAELRANQNRMRAITDSLPALVGYVDASERFQFANRAYEGWYAVTSSDIVGKKVVDVMGERAYSAVSPHIATALSGKTVRYQATILYPRGVRHVEATYIPHYGPDNRVHGFIGLETDISERKQAEDARALAVARSERLTRITAAIADAVTRGQVYEAVVDQVAAALEASSGGLFMLRDDSVVELLHSTGYLERAKPSLTALPIDSQPTIPALDVIRSASPLWIDSQEELLEKYPHLAPLVTPGRAYSIGCLPVIVQGRALASLAFTFDNVPSLDRDQRHFLMLVARYAGQALERLRLLELEQGSRQRAEFLYSLAASMNSAITVDGVFDAALESVEKVLGARRSAILVCDSDGIMRFRAWRGLSDDYRRAVDGHSPWPRDAVAPAPVLVEDVEKDVMFKDYLPLFSSEGIGSLGFIPLVARGRLIGKFMVYYDKPHAISPPEMDIAQAIAHHVAAAIARFSAVEELEETVRFNELFAGVLGHDLRNPLNAIMASAQLGVIRSDSDKVAKPFNRIVSSGNRMSRMIDQLLDFTRVRVGKGIALAAQPFDLAGLLRQTLDELESANPEWRFSFETIGDTTGAWDPDRLSQVFSNLVGNAVQHGSADSGARIKLDGSGSDSVQVEVHNMGMIAQELLPRIFEPLTGGQGRTEKSTGLGLGLYISKELVSAHGGQIAVRSSKDAGTIFTVSLPRYTTREM